MNKNMHIRINTKKAIINFNALMMVSQLRGRRPSKECSGGTGYR